MRQISVARLFEDHRDRLQLTWVSAVNVDRHITLKESGNYGADVVGHLNLIHPERLQVFGAAEHQWASSKRGERLRLLVDADRKSVV